MRATYTRDNAMHFEILSSPVIAALETKICYSRHCIVGKITMGHVSNMSPSVLT